MREFLRNLHKNSRKGFTMAELLVVIAITGILASFGFVEVTRYQHKLKRVEMDNIAREIFVAAQNQLTAAKTSGTWEAAYFTSEQVTLNTQYPWQQATTASQLSDYPSSSQLTAGKHSYYYVVYNNTTCADALTNRASALTLLLPYGTIDETERVNGSYIIEFDAQTESVYGVFYTDKGKITPEDMTWLNDNRTNTDQREWHQLQNDSAKCSIGYYGGAIAMKNEVSTMTAPDLYIYNDGIDADGKSTYADGKNNVLQVVLLDPNPSSTGARKVQIEVKQLLSTSAPGQIKNYTSVFTIEISSTKTITVTKKSGDINATKMARCIYTKPYGSNGIEYHISFDDISDGDKHFNDLFKAMTPGCDFSVKATVINPSDETQTKDSATRIGNSNFSSIKYVTSSNAASSTDVGFYQAVIRTPRHLANLSERISQYASDAEAKYSLLSAVLANDIDWKAYKNDYLLTTSSRNITTTNDSDSTYQPSNQTFLAITNDTLQYFDGAGYTLNGFDIWTKSDTDCGLFGSTTKNLNFEVKDLNLKDISVTSAEDGVSGALIGSANGAIKLSNVHVYDSDSTVYETNKIASEAGAGGLVGEINSTATIDQCSASVKVKATNTDSYAGGLIGAVKGTTVITNTYVGGKVSTNKMYDLSNADATNVSGAVSGGFIGSIAKNISVTASNSYTTASVYGIANNNGAGGFVGEILGPLSVKNVYSAGGVATISTNSYVGAFAGNVTSKGKISLSGDYAGVLDKVSMQDDLVGNDTDDYDLSKYTADNLKGYVSENAKAEPYLTDLGTTYPFPCTVDDNGNTITHHGDWCEEYHFVAGTGLYYFEKYDDNTYQVHGYQDSVTFKDDSYDLEIENTDVKEIGNQIVGTRLSSTVVDDGYVLGISNSLMDRYFYLLSSWDTIYIRANTIGWPGYSLRTLLYYNIIEQVTDPEIIGAINSDNTTYFRLNNHSSNYSDYWANFWTAMRSGFEVRLTSLYGNYPVAGSYSMGPYFADTVMDGIISDDGAKAIHSEYIRSARQLFDILAVNGKNVTYSWTNPNLNIIQELNVDLSTQSKYTGQSLTKIENGITYSGATTNGAYVTLKGIENTFVQTLDSGCTITNLNVKFDLSKLTTLMVYYSAYSSNGYYGMFVNLNEGILSHLNFSNANVKNIQVGYSSYYLSGFGLVGFSNYDNADEEYLTVSDSEWSGFTAYSNNLSLFGNNCNVLDNVTLSNVSMHDVIVKSSYAANILYSYESEGFAGMIKGIFNKSGNAENAINIKDVTMYNITTNSDTTGIIGYIGGAVTSCNLENVSIHDSTSSYNGSTSTTAIIGTVNANVNDLSFNNVQMYNNVIKSYCSGMIGNVYSTIDGLKVSNTSLYNTSAKTISSTITGLICNIDTNGKLTGLNIAKNSDTGYGFQMNNLTLNTQYWGVIAINLGTVNGTSDTHLVFNDIKIAGINSSAEASTNSTRSYGIVGLNNGKFTYFDMNNIRLGGTTDAEKILLPKNESNQFTRDHFGIVGYNKGSDTNEISNGTLSDIQIVNIRKTNTTKETTDYGIIGVNYAPQGNAKINTIKISNYTSNGNGIIWMNMWREAYDAYGSKDYSNGDIENITITNDASHKIAGNAFALKNFAAMKNCVVKDASNSTTTIPGGGVVENCSLNGNPISGS